jgi:hypothetical protein
MIDLRAILAARFKMKNMGKALSPSSGSTACSSELNETSNFSLHFPGSCILTNESFVMKARVFEKIYGYFSQIFAVKDAGVNREMKVLFSELQVIARPKNNRQGDETCTTHEITTHPVNV